jgi:hypothetical protein
MTKPASVFFLVKSTKYYLGHIDTIFTYIILIFLFFYLSNRLQYTTKGTKALRLLGDGGRKNSNGTHQDHKFNPKESFLHKNTARGNAQRRLLLKNGEVNISRYIINYHFDQT